MNWGAAVFASLFVLAVAAGVAGLATFIHWMGTEFGSFGALAAMVVVASIGVGVAVGVSERDR